MKQGYGDEKKSYQNHFFHVAKLQFFAKSLGNRKRFLFLRKIFITMKRFRKKALRYIILIGVVVLFCSACKTTRSSRAIRKAERAAERQEAQARREYKKAKAAHYKHQAPKTKKMIREDRKRARQLNRHLRRN
jgi:type VI protein secretion system component VasK